MKFRLVYDPQQWLAHWYAKRESDGAETSTHITKMGAWIAGALGRFTTP